MCLCDEVEVACYCTSTSIVCVAPPARIIIVRTLYEPFSSLVPRPREKKKDALIAILKKTHPNVMNIGMNESSSSNINYMKQHASQSHPNFNTINDRQRTLEDKTKTSFDANDTMVSSASSLALMHDHSVYNPLVLAQQQQQQ